MMNVTECVRGVTLGCSSNLMVFGCHSNTARPSRPHHPRNLHNHNNMARLNVIIDSDDDLPELSTLLARSTIANERQHPPPSQSKSAQQYLPSSSCEKPGSGIAPARTGSAKKQRSLKLAHVGSLRIPLTGLDGLPSGKGPLSTTSYIRSSPRKAVRSPPQREPIRASFTGSSDFEDDFSDHMSDFIVSDWESDGVYGDYTQQSHNPLPKRQSQTPVDLFPKRHFPPRNIKAKNLDETASLPKDEAVKASAAGSLGEESLLHVMPTAGTVWKDHESSLERSRSVLKLFVFKTHVMTPGYAEFFW